MIRYFILTQKHPWENTSENIMGYHKSDFLSF